MTNQISQPMSQVEKNPLDYLKSLIVSYPEFPQPGIVFRDIWSIFRSSNDVDLLQKQLLNRVKLNSLKYQQSINHNDTLSSVASAHAISHVVALESRGFVLGVQLAQSLSASFIPIRKAGKLPGKLTRIKYSKEYGKPDTLEIQSDAIPANSNCIIIDDLMATGGTAAAAVKLIQQLNNGSTVQQVITVIELTQLNGRKAVQKAATNQSSIIIDSLIQYDN